MSLRRNNNAFCHGCYGYVGDFLIGLIFGQTEVQENLGLTGLVVLTQFIHTPTGNCVIGPNAKINAVLVHFSDISVRARQRITCTNTHIRGTESKMK